MIVLNHGEMLLMCVATQGEARSNKDVHCVFTAATGCFLKAGLVCFYANMRRWLTSEKSSLCTLTTEKATNPSLEKLPAPPRLDVSWCSFA